MHCSDWRAPFLIPVETYTLPLHEKFRQIQSKGTNCIDRAGKALAPQIQKQTIDILLLLSEEKEEG